MTGRINHPAGDCRGGQGDSCGAGATSILQPQWHRTIPAPPTAPDPHLVPPILATWLSVFRPCFTAPVWNRVLVLVAGAVLAPGKRTVTQVLRVMGLADEPRLPSLS